MALAFAMAPSVAAGALRMARRQAQSQRCQRSARPMLRDNKPHPRLLPLTRGYDVNVEELDMTESWSMGQVGEIMTSTKVVSAQPDHPLSSAASKLDKITGLAVVDADNTVVGVISIKDINRLKKQGVSMDEPVSRHMSTPPIVVNRDTMLADAAALMLARKIHRLPVVDEAGKLIGIVSRTDVWRRAQGAQACMATALTEAAEGMGSDIEDQVAVALEASIDDEYLGPESSVPSDAWQVKYLYDGDCSMCQALVSMLKRQDGGRGLINFVNIASINYSPDENEGILYEEAMETIHAVLRNGTILKGTDALKTLYDTVGLGWAARLGDLPIISDIVDWVYEFLSKNRLPMSRNMDAILAMRRMKMTSEGIEHCVDDEEECEAEW